MMDNKFRIMSNKKIVLEKNSKKKGQRKKNKQKKIKKIMVVLFMMGFDCPLKRCYHFSR